MTGYCTIIATAPTEQEADKITEILLNERVVACVQQLPIKSSYHWQGKVEISSEILMIMKSQTKLYSKIESLIKKNHSYQVPEIILLPIEAGLADYLNWIRTETG